MAAALTRIFTIFMILFLYAQRDCTHRCGKIRSKEQKMSDVVDRFLRYVQIDTQSDPNSDQFPSTSKQLVLANLLLDELIKLGLDDASLDQNGYVMATLIGWIAHMDTSPDMSGTNVKPQVVKNYDGGDIVLNQKEGIVLSPLDFPEMKNYIGQTIITSDGNTLLGADDKAGVAAIMVSRRMKKLGAVLTGLMSINLERILLILWMGARLVSWSMRTLMQQVRALL